MLPHGPTLCVYSIARPRCNGDGHIAATVVPRPGARRCAAAPLATHASNPRVLTMPENARLLVPPSTVFFAQRTSLLRGRPRCQHRSVRLVQPPSPTSAIPPLPHSFFCTRHPSRCADATHSGSG